MKMRFVQPMGLSQQWLIHVLDCFQQAQEHRSMGFRHLHLQLLWLWQKNHGFVCKAKRASRLYRSLACFFLLKDRIRGGSVIIYNRWSCCQSID